MRYALAIPEGLVIDRAKTAQKLKPLERHFTLKCAWAGMASTRCYLQHIICDI